MTIADTINEQLVSKGLPRLTAEQVECLTTPARVEEAVALLHDLKARCGVRLALPPGDELATAFENEEDAREEAAKQAVHFDAVCVEAMATDNRMRSTDEYYVIRFTGPEAALAAASHSQAVAYWVAGQEC